MGRWRAGVTAVAAVAVGLTGVGLQAQGANGRAPIARAAAAPKFSLSPVAGPGGTTVDVESVTPCGTAPYSAWKVTLDVVLPVRSDGIPVIVQKVAVDSHGQWSAHVAVPVGALAGVGEVQASCQGPSSQTVQYETGHYDVTTGGRGYWLLGRQPFRRVDCLCGIGATSNVADYGDAPFSGPMPASVAFARAVGAAANPLTGRGYWVAASDGGVFSFGDAPFLGSAYGLHLAQPIVGIASGPGCCAYWLAGRDGGVFAFHTGFHGSAATLPLRAPIVGIASTPTGRGYWLVAADGGVFTFGDAPFYGSAADLHLTAPIVGIAASGDGGYWLAAADGGVFSFGHARFAGSAVGRHLASPIVGIAASGDGGYWLAGADGGVFSFGTAQFQGSCATCGTGFVAITATPSTYTIVP